jgi:hypothetical protein
MDRMADTLLRPSRQGRGGAAEGSDDGPTTRPVVLVGIAVAGWTVALGVAILVCLTLTAWVTAAHHDDAIHPAIAAALQAWLLAQHTAIGLGGHSGGAVTIVPIGLTVLLGALLVRGGRLAARHSGGSDFLDAAASTFSVSVPYAVMAALLTKPAQVGTVRPSPLQALVGALLLAVLCTGLGALRECGLLTPLFGRIPDDARSALRAGFAASAVIVGVGGAAVVVGLAASAGRAAELASSVHGGYSGVVLMGIISMAYAPNVVGWASAYSLGPGFAVGTQTSVSLHGVHLGAVPSLPLLAPLPNSGSSPVLGWLMVAGPVAGGALAGWLIARGRAVTPPAQDAEWWVRYRLSAAAWGLAAGGAGGTALAVLCWLSAGSLGAGRMSELGPSAAWVLLAAVLEIGIVAAATIWVHGWNTLRRPPREIVLDGGS